ncbi:MAG: hypothetical protein A3C06_00060 [Candidatus Taylorbacteria bacterium RIFCSPHIGHO2_02_FULL_46_13]|uniref:Metallo-beta-lactamase domain-containing protein n=1 Tax=Candidatus Taylorbacteria bacterium RIFCSPHIGHO2_02_FULL_46_13 TaxID=1802312 RepID=A0A1G2MS47_9BACT|nr:MAG: hypothetical protein A3C06_00060 [Candidatus Taylorbacteria bacterium RIFCSPHIGHO2_02_FULL_46_13]
MQKWKTKVGWILLAGLALGVALLWYVLLHEDRQGLLRVTALDIGQGDAIFIEAPNGYQILLDAGPGPVVLRRLGEFMPFYDRSIDLLIVSNPDKDHIAGFIDVLNRYKVSREIEPGTLNASAVYATLQDSLKRKNVPQVLARTGDRVVLDEKHGVVLDILFPDRDVPTLATNDGSIIAKLSYGGTCFMLMGDSTQGVEEYLVHLFGPALHCQVLKVGHHGSRSATSAVFVKDMAPEYAVISDGKNNTYGHPHQETLDTLNNFGVKVLRTDLLGSVTFVSDGKTVRPK